MSKCLSRDQYYHLYNCGDKTFCLRDLFSTLEIEAKEVISQKFDDILKLVKRRFRKLSPKYHPDKRDDKEIANKEFQKFTADKEELEKHLNALKEGKNLNKYRELSKQEAWKKQEKIDEILSHKSTVLNRAVLFFILANTVLNPLPKVKFCLLQLAANGSVQNIAYQLYAFSTGVWPWLFIVALCSMVYLASKQEGGSLEEDSDRFNQRMNGLNTVNNCVICIASIFAVCSLASEVVQNGWPVQYGAMLATNLALDLLLIVLFRTFIKASELYSEHCIQRLYEEEAEFSYKEKFAWYDPCKIFMPIVLPLVKMLYEGFIQEKPQQTTEPKVTPLEPNSGANKQNAGNGRLFLFQGI